MTLIPDNIRSSVRLFADNCVLYRNIKSLTDRQNLQDDLTSLTQWETDWQMKFNVAKCHSMRVTRHLSLRSWNEVNMFLKFLVKQLRHFFGAIRHTKEVAYKTFVRPQLEYAAPIWHPYNETETKKVEKCRRQQPGGPAGDGGTGVASTTCWTNSSGHP